MRGILVGQDLSDCGGILFAKIYDSVTDLNAGMLEELLRLDDDYGHKPVTIKHYRDNYGEIVTEATYGEGEKMLYKTFLED